MIQLWKAKASSFVGKGRFWAAVLVAVLAWWRLPYVLEGSNASTLLANSALGLVLTAAVAMLLIRAFAVADHRLNKIAYALGFGFSCFLTIGKILHQNGELPPITLGAVLDMLLTVGVFTVLLGGAVALLYDQALRICGGMAAKHALGKPETRLSRLAGNGWVAFAWLLLCWIPVWLAFWPGTFCYDAPTQFASFMDESLNAANPILHTLLLGWCLNAGVEAGELSVGIALYCGLQMLAMAGILAYACHWLWKRDVALGARLCVMVLFGLFPLYPLWSFSATKDVLFSGFVLLVMLEWLDLLREGRAIFRKPWRLVRFLSVAVLMLLLRPNGALVFGLSIPFVMLAAKGMRGRVCVLCVGAVMLYGLCNFGLIAATEAERGSSVEAFSVPLQQIARVASKNPDALTAEDQEKINELYTDDLGTLYDPQIADPIKWAMDYDTFEGDTMRYLGLWAKLGLANPGIYAEALLVQNLPYYYPEAPMRYNIVLGVEHQEMYPMEAKSLLPRLQPAYIAYDKQLTFLALPASHLLSSPALMAWLCMLCYGLALYRKQRGMRVACGFLLMLWLTNLLGPVAIMRYMLGLFYGVPVLCALVFAKTGCEGANAPAQPAPKQNRKSLEENRL
ncbi:MAG: DUF6020 family protein [Clostridia bacterium]